MKCPFCCEGEFAVQDSRSLERGLPIRRRRVCSHCKRRVWTVEKIEDVPLKVIKKTDQRREAFSPAKLRRGLDLACYKCPVTHAQIEHIVQQVENELYANHFGEVPSSVIGDLVMEHLKQLNQVAYVRFASVYREFRDPEEFVQEVKPMLNGKEKGKKKRVKRKAGEGGKAAAEG